MSHDAQGLPATEIARLAMMRRLSMGTAHAMNNALSVAMGEAGFLYDDYKGNPEIAEACQAILSAVDRCARLTQALLRHSDPAPASDDETGADLVRIVRDLERWLREAIGSRNKLRIEAPDDLVLVAVPESELELLVMGLVAFASDQGDEACDLHLRVESGEAGEPIALRLTSSVENLSDDVIAALETPDRATRPLDSLILKTLREQVIARGGEWHVARTDPQSYSLLIRLPSPTQRRGRS